MIIYSEREVNQIHERAEQSSRKAFLSGWGLGFIAALMIMKWVVPLFER
jgi:hypothetical protein